MKRILVMLMGVGVLTGCGTKILEKKPVDIDQEPVLVGKNINERVGESQSKIQEQLTLLRKLESGKPVEQFQVVQHNNDMDARINSEQTIPKAYAFAEREKQKELEKERISSLLASKIKIINWQNNSTNVLLENFAKLMGYELIINNQTKDQKINYVVNNVTVDEAIKKLTILLTPVADLSVNHDSRKIKVTYK